MATCSECGFAFSEEGFHASSCSKFEPSPSVGTTKTSGGAASVEPSADAMAVGAHERSHVPEREDDDAVADGRLLSSDRDKPGETGNLPRPSDSVSDECECPPEGHMLGCKRDRLEPLKQRASEAPPVCTGELANRCPRCMYQLGEHVIRPGDAPPTCPEDEQRTNEATPKQACDLCKDRDERVMPEWRDLRRILKEDGWDYPGKPGLTYDTHNKALETERGRKLWALVHRTDNPSAEVEHWKSLYTNLLREHDAWASIANNAFDEVKRLKDALEVKR